ncbi:MAG: PTS sugar transporter subunit IIA [Symbiobacteriia bacterium]
MLEEMLYPGAVRLSHPAGDWQDAVRICGRLLVAVGAVEDRYVDAMLRVVHDLGPYVVLAPGFAMPHARPEDGVLRPALSLVTLRTPVCFGHPENDPVDIVVGLAATDAGEHVEALADLAYLMSQPEYPTALRQAHTPWDALRLIRRAVTARQGTDD